MTTHQKRMIELSDIVSFCFTCVKCGSSLSIPGSACLEPHRPSKCPSCDEVWMTPSTGSIRKFLELREALKNLSESVGENDKFTLAIEISSDPVSTSKD